MDDISATFRIVTPMFIGGAEHEVSGGVRPPSFKGALRFWWRALNWGRFRRSSESDAEALRELNREEARLFGAAAKVERGRRTGGQGVFQLRITSQPDLKKIVSDWPNLHTKRGEKSKSGYMGLGLFEMGDHKRRKGLKEGQDFEVSLLFRANADEGDREQIQDALKALGLFGGLGSRSRKAFGSVALMKMDDESTACSDVSEYEAHCRAMMRSDIQELPPFTAFSALARFGILETGHADPRKAHGALARVYFQVRGQNGEVKGKDKLAFGLPLKGYTKEDDVRRGSPLLMHVHPVGGQFVAGCLFLPAMFHPDYPQGRQLGFYHGVETFMDRLQEARA